MSVFSWLLTAGLALPRSGCSLGECLRSTPDSPPPSCPLGCTPESCKPCARPGSRRKKGPRVSHRDINGLTDGGSLHFWSKVLERHPIVDGRRRAAQGSSSLCLGRGREVTSYRGNWRQVGSWVTKETSREARPFDKLSQWRGSDLKIGTITSWGPEQVCRHFTD